jgi:hypothetical protein
MLPDSVTEALKEWAVVQRSLLEGHQILLVRKGGLIEETGDFDLRADTFAIQPTYIHETEHGADLQTCFLDWLRDEEAKHARASQNEVRVDCICAVTDIIRVDDRKKLVTLMPQHIWSREFVDNRYEWNPYKPVFVLLCRAYALPSTIALPWHDDYGGCRSWSPLRQPVSTTGAVPVVCDDSFEQRRALTKSILTA